MGITVYSKDLLYNTTVNSTKNITTEKQDFGNFFIILESNQFLLNIMFSYKAFITNEGYYFENCYPLSPPCYKNKISILIDENATIKVLSPDNPNNSYASFDNSTLIKEINNYNFIINPKYQILIGFHMGKEFDNLLILNKVQIINISYMAIIKNNIINTNENSFLKSFNYDNTQTLNLTYNYNSYNSYLSS